MNFYIAFHQLEHYLMMFGLGFKIITTTTFYFRFTRQFVKVVVAKAGILKLVL